VLLVGAGLFARSLNNLKHLDLGLRPENLIAFSIAPELNGYSPQRTIALFDQLHQNLETQPGIESVSGSLMAAFTDSNSSSNITVEGYTAQENEDMNVGQNHIGTSYFSTMGIPLVQGREFGKSDTATSPKVAIINEAMSRRFFAGRDPVGSRFTFGAGNRVHPDIDIVGVVKDSRHAKCARRLCPLYIFRTPSSRAWGA
jgi:hypothetical protein